MWLLALLALTPEGLPEGSIAIERAPVPDLAQLPFGEGLPPVMDSGALQSMVEAEAILLAVSELEPTTDSKESREQAMYVTEECERALVLLGGAARDPALRVPSLARSGDASRLVLQAIQRVRPSPSLPVEDLDAFHAQLAEAAAPVAQDARTAYERVLGDLMAAAVWKAHARWGLEELE